ncbi:unnamed protein product [Paramecium sonneborni]|uniref:Uncharacterized protein n=1 Tax=Paramecium sonneborni TaxID=65129 RepID=A0A8S1QV21_9CILI|nr:unnamed protein product [Paramecium sonneborni]CAD8119598.1 unnamed protein product [Paramecium sonneborni]
MNMTFYKQCFQTLQGLYELKLISKDEKLLLKGQILKLEIPSDDGTSVEDLSKYFLSLLKQKKRHFINVQTKLHLDMIDEETDEEQL